MRFAFLMFGTRSERVPSFFSRSMAMPRFTDSRFTRDGLALNFFEAVIQLRKLIERAQQSKRDQMRE